MGTLFNFQRASCTRSTFGLLVVVIGLEKDFLLTPSWEEMRVFGIYMMCVRADMLSCFSMKCVALSRRPVRLASSRMCCTPHIFLLSMITYDNILEALLEYTHG